MIDRTAVRNNANYLRNVRPIDPEEIASELQGIVGLTRHEKDSNDAMDEIVERLTDEGCVALIVGPPGAGKTATTLDAARYWGVRTGGYMFGNTSWDGFDDVVSTDVEMLEEMASVEGQALGIVDESNQNLSGEGTDSKKAQQFVDRMTFIRKKERSHGPHAKKGSVLMVSHTRKRTAAAFRRLSSFAIEKPKRDDPGFARLLETEGGQDSLEDGPEFTGLTDTRESYSEHEASEFRILGADGDDGDETEDGPQPDEIRREEAIASALRAVRPWDDETGATYREAGNIAGYSPGWVSDRVAEWRDGEYRDIVNTPEGET